VRYKIHIILLLAILIGAACRDKSSPGNDLPGEGVVLIDLSQRFQEIEGFGASDAWSIQYVGNWPEEKRNKIANLLFSKDMDELGNPKGIGLNTWRFNIGAGSKPQGGISNINDKWRRTEGFLQNGETYDWNQQSGQRWFLQAAKERGVENFIAFVNSPPVQLTKNGKANTSVAGSSNLDEDKYDDYSDFLVQVLEHFEQEENIDFDLISPLNEPQWDWSGGQEGCPYVNSEISKLTKSVSAKLLEAKLSTMIELTEAGDIIYLYDDNTDRNSKDNQIEEFYFTGDNTLSNLPNISHNVAGHSYWSTDQSEIIPQRAALWDKIESALSLNGYSMTEYCIMDNEEILGQGRDLGITSALYMARVIHYDLTVANASSWQWWLAVSPYDYKDGLIYIDKSESDGQIYTSKMLFALGNYSRFIDKGMHRVNTSQLFGKNNNDDFTYSRVMTSAYASEANNKIVVVMVNYNNWEYTTSFDIGDEWTERSMKIYRTTDTEELKFIGMQKVSNDIVIAPLSITTYIITK
jgi:O-glycosyl hydrolase